MLALIVRAVLLLTASLTSWLATDSAPNYNTLQMVAAMLLWVAFVLVLAAWDPGRSAPHHR